MAFRREFKDELRQNIPENVEVATDNSLIEGVLVGVQDDTIRVVETIPGYTPTTRVLIIPIAAINFVRLISKP